MNICKWVAVVALLGFAAQPAGAFTRNWLGGSATWDDTTTANWSDGAVPVNGDTANLTQSSASNLSIGYTATGLTGSGLAQLTIGNAGGGTNTLNLDGTDSLPTDKFTLSIGGAVSMSGGTLGAAAATANSISQLNAGTFTLSGGLWQALSGANNGLNVGGSGATGPATLNLQGTGDIKAYTSAGEYNLVVGGSATYSAVLNQTGGSISRVFKPKINNGGTYNLSNGTMSAVRALEVNAGGRYNQNGGTATYQFGVTVGGGALHLSGGTLAPNGDITVGTKGTVNLTGGEFKNTGLNYIGVLNLNGAGASWNMRGPTLVVRKEAGTGLILASFATIRGYGNIYGSWYPHATRTENIDTSGRIVADGHGADNTLDMSRFRLVLNATDNTTSNGWFAVNGGKLMLPNIAVMAGSSVTNWGEAVADTTIDLVNSARIAFTGATAGNLTGALLAVDRADVPAGLYRPTAIWTFGGVACASATLTLRYDDAAAAALNVGEADLRVWRHTGAKWLEITGTQDTGAKTITSQATGSLAVTSFFAVAGKAPAAGTLVTVR